MTGSYSNLYNDSSCRFAQVNVKFAIATIIRNFKVTVDTSKTEIPLKYDPKLAIIGPIGGFWANFERIK